MSDTNPDKYTNPITGEAYSQRNEYVESLVEELVKLEKLKFQIGEIDEKLFDSIKTLAGNKKCVLDGTTRCLKVTPRENVSYEKERGGEHPLRTLLGQYEVLLRNGVRAEYKEAGSVIEDLLAKHRDPSETLTEEELELVAKLEAVRKVKFGKPAVEVKDLKKEDDK